MSFSLGREVSDHKIYNFGSRLVSSSIVLETGSASYKVVASQHSLFDGFGFMAANFDNFNRLRSLGFINLELGGVNVSFKVVSLQNLLSTTFRIVVLINALLLLNTLFKCFIHFATLRYGVRANNCRSIVLNSGECLGGGGMLLIICLLKYLGRQGLLQLFVGVLLGNAVVRSCHSSFSSPICVRSESNLCHVAVVLNWRLFNVASAEHTGLQVLVLSVLAVKVRSLESVLSIDRFVLRILPVYALSHKSAISLVVVDAVLISSFSVEVPSSTVSLRELLVCLLLSDPLAFLGLKGLNEGVV